jgi:hypothetical protein
VADLLSRYSKRKPAKALIYEASPAELTLGDYIIEDDIIKDRMKNRAFVTDQTPVYLNIEKDIKKGRYPIFQLDALVGAAIELRREKSDAAAVKMTVYGQTVNIQREKANMTIVTSAESIYNILDNKLMFTLLQIKPQMWQLILCILFGALIGFVIKGSM